MGRRFSLESRILPVAEGSSNEPIPGVSQILVSEASLLYLTHASKTGLSLVKFLCPGRELVPMSSLICLIGKFILVVRHAFCLFSLKFMPVTPDFCYKSPRMSFWFNIISLVERTFQACPLPHSYVEIVANKSRGWGMMYAIAELRERSLKENDQLGTCLGWLKPPGQKEEMGIWWLEQFSVFFLSQVVHCFLNLEWTFRTSQGLPPAIYIVFSFGMLKVNTELPPDNINCYRVFKKEPLGGSRSLFNLPMLDITGGSSMPLASVLLPAGSG